MARHHFRGYPSFLAAAAEQFGHPEAALPARRNEALSALANLCAQASEADEAHVEGILAKAGEFRDQLRVASRAAELMLADVQAGRGLARPVAPTVRLGMTPEPVRRSKPTPSSS